MAIIEIDAPASRRTEVRLDGRRAHADGEPAIVIGWGATGQGARHADLLQEAVLPLLSDAKCDAMYRAAEDSYQIRRTQICTLAERGDRDTCQGDSGGPLFRMLPSGPSLVGVISSGISCADIHSPGVSLPQLTNISSTRASAPSARGSWTSWPIASHPPLTRSDCKLKRTNTSQAFPNHSTFHQHVEHATSVAEMTFQTNHEPH